MSGMIKPYKFHIFLSFLRHFMNFHSEKLDKRSSKSGHICYLPCKNQPSEQISHHFYIHLFPTVGCLFSRATDFANFMDFWTYTKFVSPKISKNSIVTWIAD